MGVGFIRDKLEIKFLILYIAARVIEPVPPEGMQELTMCDEGIDYFAFSECLADLVRTGHLRLTEDGAYAITPKGMKNSEICESGIPYSVRLRTDRNLEAFNRELLRRSQVRGFVRPGEDGTFTVELALNDDRANVMHLSLLVASQEMADDLVRRFKEKPEEVYSAMLSALYQTE